jgi:hypothetical protein
MRSTLFVEAEAKERMKPVEESKPSSWSKCRVLAMITMVSWYWEQVMCLGSWTQLLEEGSRKESIFLYLTCMLELPNSKFG